MKNPDKDIDIYLVQETSTDKLAKSNQEMVTDLQIFHCRPH